MEVVSLNLKLAMARANHILKELVCPDFTGKWDLYFGTNLATQRETKIGNKYLCLLVGSSPNYEEWKLIIFNQAKSQGRYSFVHSKKVIKLHLDKSHEENKILAEMILL